MLCFFKHENVSTRNFVRYLYGQIIENVYFQVLAALDILQPPHLDFFQEMYPFKHHCYMLKKN